MVMKRRRPESTLYLGDELYQALERYRQSLPVPPSASALVREALRRFLQEVADEEGSLSPRAWVEATSPVVARLTAEGVQVTSAQIVDALHAAETERLNQILGT